MRIQRPPRDHQILAAVEESGGDIVTVGEDEISASWIGLMHCGLLVEPTSAVAEAAAARLLDQGVPAGWGTTVVALTGSGLKGAARFPGGTR